MIDGQSAGGAEVGNRAAAADGVVDGHAGLVVNQGPVVHDRAADGAGRASIAELQRAAADRRAARVGVGAGKDQGAAAADAKLSAAVDIAAEGLGDGAVELQRAAADRRWTGVTVAAGEDRRARARGRQAAGAADVAAEGLVGGVAEFDRAAAADRRRAGVGVVAGQDQRPAGTAAEGVEAGAAGQRGRERQGAARAAKVVAIAAGREAAGEGRGPAGPDVQAGRLAMLTPVASLALAGKARTPEELAAMLPEPSQPATALSGAADGQDPAVIDGDVVAPEGIAPRLPNARTPALTVVAPA